VVGGTFTFIHNMNPVHGVSAYLIPFLFLVGTGVGYCVRRWVNNEASFLNELNDQAKLMLAIKTLDDMREWDLQPISQQDVRWYNFWGIIFRDPVRDRLG
jgi:hypothetical protein